MSGSGLDIAQEALERALLAVREGGESIEVVAQVKEAHAVLRLADQVMVETVGALLRSGVTEQHGYGGKRAVHAVMDLLGEDFGRARRMVDAACAVCPQVDADGQAVPARLPEMAARLAAGDATVDHVVAVARLLEKPAARELTTSQRDFLEDRLAQLTVSHNPYELRAEGERLLAELRPVPEMAPPVSELRITRLPGGGVKLRGTITDAYDAEVLQVVMDSKAAPLNSEDERPLAQRQAEALVEVLQFVSDHGDNADLPSVGGSRGQVVVNIDWDRLQADAGGATLNGRVPVTPAQVRKACCDAEIIPLVLGGKSIPLDVGQSERTVRSGLRHSVTQRDGGCAHPGCDRRPNWCRVHHIREWAKGGDTKLDNLVMLCRTHHRLHHSTDWEIRIADDGLPEFIPPRSSIPSKNRAATPACALDLSLTGRGLRVPAAPVARRTGALKLYPKQNDVTQQQPPAGEESAPAAGASPVWPVPQESRRAAGPDPPERS
jgi:5-methylcytosine-specific restriction protein A